MEYKPSIQELLTVRRYNPNRTPPADQVILKIGGKKIGSLQNLITYTGKQKNGKSRFIGATIASGLTNNEIFQIQLKPPGHRQRIALFDTEQGDFDFYRQMQQIRTFAGLDQLPPWFDAFNTREDDPITILKMVSQYLNDNPDCSVLVLDGLLDLLISYNDERESKKLINLFKKITKVHNCLIIGVIHRGKGNDLSIGHLGSMADRVAQSILKIEKIKDRNTYQLSAEHLRSDDDFTPIEIWYNAGQWEETFYTPAPDDSQSGRVRNLKAQPADYDRGTHLANLSQCFSINEYQQYEELIQNIKEVYGVGRNWAVDAIKYLKSECLLYKVQEGYTIKAQAKLFIKQ